MTEEEIEKAAERYGDDLCCICRDCGFYITRKNPCSHLVDAKHGYKDGLRNYEKIEENKKKKSDYEKWAAQGKD